MKRFFSAITVLLAISFLAVNTASAQKSKKNKDKSQAAEAVPAFALQSRIDSISYMIGRDIGRNMKTNNIEVTAEVMFAGLKDGLAGIDSVLSDQVTEALMNSLQMEMMNHQQQKTQAESSAAKAAGEAFLAENKNQPGVVVTPSGLQYKVIQEGQGEHPTAEDVVEVHYTGRLIDGTVFDSSVERGETIKFPLNGVIPGWTEGVQLMKPGAKYEFYIPANLAYGDRGAGPIPGGSALIFEVELISIEKQ